MIVLLMEGEEDTKGSFARTEASITQTSKGWMRSRQVNTTAVSNSTVKHPTGLRPIEMWILWVYHEVSQQDRTKLDRGEQ